MVWSFALPRPFFLQGANQPEVFVAVHGEVDFCVSSHQLINLSIYLSTYLSIYLSINQLLIILTPQSTNQSIHHHIEISSIDGVFFISSTRLTAHTHCHIFMTNPDYDYIMHLKSHSGGSQIESSSLRQPRQPLSPSVSPHTHCILDSPSRSPSRNPSLKPAASMTGPPLTLMDLRTNKGR